MALPSAAPGGNVVRGRERRPMAARDAENRAQAGLGRRGVPERLTGLPWLIAG